MLTHVKAGVVRGLVPAGVERADAGREIGPRLVAGGLGRDKLGDAVVDAVDGLDKVLVKLEVEFGDRRVVLGQAEVGREDRAAKVLVDEAGRRELGAEALAKDLGKAPLVVVVPVTGGLVDTADVDDDRARVDWRAERRPTRSGLGPASTGEKHCDGSDRSWGAVYARAAGSRLRTTSEGVGRLRTSARPVRGSAGRPKVRSHCQRSESQAHRESFHAPAA